MTAVATARENRGGLGQMLRAALREQTERIERYRRGQLTDDEFRPHRLAYGLYRELDETSYMQRIKLPGGGLTAVQADEIAGIADDYGRGRIHVTTRQDVQLHWVALENVGEIYKRLDGVGITTLGAAANSVRNVTGCVHAGLWPGEPFDVTPYVLATHEHFLFHPLNLALPRKLKIAFAGCLDDCVQARVNDLAYFPHLRAGRPGFSVYAAGGLGAQPFLAQPIRAFLPAEDTLLLTEAVMRLWHHHGERKNRKRARMKYLFQRLGAEHFIAAVDELYTRITAEGGIAQRAALGAIVAGFHTPQPRQAPSTFPHRNDAELAHWVRTNTFAQKQHGYYGVTVQLPLGEITGAQLRGVAGLTQELGAGVLRATTDQNLLIPWISGRGLAQIHRRLRNLRLAEADALGITDVTSCPGADYCSLAVTRSMYVADAIRSQLRALNVQAEILGRLRIKVSGCPNACGQHHVGDIGLTGLAVKGKDESTRPHYSILLGGRAGESQAAIGKRIRVRFPENEVPRVVAALAEYYHRERRRGEHFGAFACRVGMGRLTRVASAAATDVC